ncbi:hypothetical protein MKW98_026932 [Papaver atlanticum]|uniref:Uncharacterized protein n=1 Tax=Papaver atlanticum TaxID=357466 RepID=A0AAD4STS5_9MAGN|nr:hypothetical protein MKW98_026932 [Papaver atlanticum]
MVHTVSSETDLGNKIPKIEWFCSILSVLRTLASTESETKPDIKIPKSEMPGYDFSTDIKPDIKIPKSEIADTKPDIRIPKSEMVDTKPDIKIPKSEMAYNPHLSDDVKPNIKPLKPEVNVKPESVENSLPAENLDEEEWVTVYGFTYEDKESVLQEFGKCGVILDYDESGPGNWMHILYQNQSEAQNALIKSGKPIKSNLIVGVNSVDAIEKQALRTELLCLLHRSEGEFFILAETGNVYNVTLSTTPSCRCNCPDSTVPCKHIFFVFLHVLQISQNDCRIWRKGLEPSQLADLLNMPTSAQTLAGARAREEFLRLFSMSEVNVGPPPKISDEDVIDVRCPVCHDDMCWGEESCLSVWRKRKAGKVHVCASCREEWISAEQNWYTNLADYMD